MSDQKNLIIAIALSVAILLGFQLLVEAPKQDRLRQQQAAQQTEQQANTPQATGQAPGQEGSPSGNLPQLPSLAQQVSEAASREKALAEAPRLRIEGKRLVGSLSLTGGRIDDI